MCQTTLDNLTLFSLFLAFSAALIAFFIEIDKQHKAQKEQQQQTQSDEKIKAEIQELQHEIILLKLEIEKMR